MIRPALAALLLLGTGCGSVGLAGSVGGAPLDFAEAVYVEQAGIDPATSAPFHDLDLWLMPMEGSCAVFTQLLADLRTLRARIDGEGLGADAYCEAWEDLYEAAVGVEPFWVANFRLHTGPGALSEEVVTRYAWYDEGLSEPSQEAWFDADVARYPTPDFDACGAEFSGAAPEYAPELFPARAGEAEITAYEPEVQVKFELRPQLVGQDEDPEGSGTADVCVAALDWPLVFGRGI